MVKEITVKQNEELLLPIFWNGKEDAISYTVYLAERGAKLRLLGLLLGHEEESVNITITVHHSAPETESEVVLRGALSDSAKINFEGLVKIHSGAKGTKAWLAAHLLLLSNRAKGRAIPSLEILENDIKAGHATTVGKINEMELFYLMSRGLSRSKAKQLVVEGYVKGLLTRFPENLQKEAQKALKQYNK